MCLVRVGGKWRSAIDRYLGLKFKIKGRPHFGWARLTVRDSLPISVTLTGYAYETVPGKAIIAGQIHGPEDDIVPDASLTAPSPGAPQRASLGMLALGAQGVPLWRRKEEIETLK